MHQLNILNQSLADVEKTVVGDQKSGFDILFVQSGRGALVAVIEFAVAPPNHPAVLAVGVPYLGTVEVTAVAANDAGRNNALTAVSSAQGLPALELRLDGLEFFWSDDGRMTVLNIILWDLALVDLLLFSQKVNRVLLLEEGIAFVLFVGEDAFDGGGRPFGSACGCGNLFIG